MKRALPKKAHAPSNSQRKNWGRWQMPTQSSGIFLQHPSKEAIYAKCLGSLGQNALEVLGPNALAV